ncbi:MAG TPA: cytidine deaminase [Sphingomicrobium sp.]|nr:cytidine deaminase [Sphingomicrobium sp.]
MTEEELVALAREAAGRAYAPYSNFHVGCAVESVDGEVVTGANMENACYRLGLCAEQSALTAAQHAFGLGKVARIAVAGGSGEMVCTPCGGCRQAIFEAACLSGRDIAIICASGDGSAVERRSIGELLPSGFGPANLDDSAVGQIGCDAHERSVLDMVKLWPGRPALVTWDETDGWSVGTPPEHLPPE